MVFDSDPWVADARDDALRGDISGGRHFETAGRSRGRAGLLKSVSRTQRVRPVVVDSKARTKVSDQGTIRSGRIGPVVDLGTAAQR